MHFRSNTMRILAWVVLACLLLPLCGCQKGLSKADAESILVDAIREIAGLEDGAEDSMMNIIVDGCSIDVQACQKNDDGFLVDVNVKNHDAIAALNTLAEEKNMQQSEFLYRFEEIFADSEIVENSFQIQLLSADGEYEAQIDMIVLDACLGGFLRYVDNMLTETEGLNND